MKKYWIILFAISTLETGAQNIMAQAELEAENVDEVRIDGSFINVYVSDGDKVFFSGIIEGNGDEDDYRFDADIIGSTLVIKVVSLRNGYGWKNRKVTKSRINLTITDGVKLDIDNSSGDINVANLRASESKIEATSGDVRLRSIVANLKIETSSGDIDIEGLIGDSKIESTSGDQELRDIKGNIEARASSGSIRISDFNGTLDLEATSGDIDFIGGKGKFDIRTTSGRIEGRRVLLIGDSNFDATSGDIEIDFDNPLDELSFDLSATSGDLEVGNRSSEKRLRIDRGGYKVTSVTSSGDQEYD